MHSYLQKSVARKKQTNKQHPEFFIRFNFQYTNILIQLKQNSAHTFRIYGNCFPPSFPSLPFSPWVCLSPLSFFSTSCFSFSTPYYSLLKEKAICKYPSTRNHHKRSKPSVSESKALSGACRVDASLPPPTPARPVRPS